MPRFMFDIDLPDAPVVSRVFRGSPIKAIHAAAAMCEGKEGCVGVWDQPNANLPAHFGRKIATVFCCGEDQNVMVETIDEDGEPSEPVTVKEIRNVATI